MLGVRSAGRKSSNSSSDLIGYILGGKDILRGLKTCNVANGALMAGLKENNVSEICAVNLDGLGLFDPDS